MDSYLFTLLVFIWSVYMLYYCISSFMIWHRGMIRKINKLKYKIKDGKTNIGKFGLWQKKQNNRRIKTHGRTNRIINQ